MPLTLNVDNKYAPKKKSSSQAPDQKMSMIPTQKDDIPDIEETDISNRRVRVFLTAFVRYAYSRHCPRADRKRKRLLDAKMSTHKLRKRVLNY